MATVLFENERVISLDSIDSEEDLKPMKGRIIINGPPEDGRCQCCGKHISELKPFGGPGDPLAGDFTGAYLIKMFRLEFPIDNREAWTAVTEVVWKGNGELVMGNELLELLIARHGTKKGQEYYEWWINYDYLVGKSWECRDCVCLDDFEYFDKFEEARLRRQASDVKEECTEATDPEKSR
jgi:hypothetical protein